MRIYQEPITVQFRDVPTQFVWRGRLLRILTVQTLTRASTAWWQHPDRTGIREREVWRVEAESGRAGRGVYELARTVGENDWQLHGVED